MNKVITKHQLNRILKTVYPGGYGKDNTRYGYQDDWFIGWLGINNKSQAGLPMEVNIDGEGTYIIFTWWDKCYDQMTNDEIAAYLRGVMSQIMPDMVLDEESSKPNATHVAFKFVDDEND